jgi:hydrogenase expression/formation protein HypC
MCLAIPGRLVEHQGDRDGLAFAVVEFDGLRRSVCLQCVPEAVVGDYVLVHAGLAISRVDAEEARRLLEDLRAIGELEDGP